MQKLTTKQSLSQQMSPQQIQYIKLLQIPTVELESRIEEEKEINPALEDGPSEDYDSKEDLYEKKVDESYEEVDRGGEESFESEVTRKDEINEKEYLQDDDFKGYKMSGDGRGTDEAKDIPMSDTVGLNEQLLSQLGFLKLSEREENIAKQLIGSIEADGYIRRDLEAILNDLAFTNNIESDIDELENTLFKIQEFDPPGIAARNLQECLVIQVKRKKTDLDEKDAEMYLINLALEILENYFEEFTKKHWEKIIKKLGLEDENDLKLAIQLIKKLNPKPGGISNRMVVTQYLIPDFILETRDGGMDLRLNSRNAPELHVSRSYQDTLHAYSKSDKKDKKLKETVTFVKAKLDAAKWFIDAIKQRQMTLLNTMRAIMDFQQEFFIEGDESKLRPMILKDIADIVKMDISTVSRVANSKTIQTEFGIFPLKYFFSEGIMSDSGENVSSREVKSALKDLIAEENKKKPLSDDKLVKLLKDKGYNIARRTVAKYRDQMGLPVARLRKEV